MSTITSTSTRSLSRATSRLQASERRVFAAATATVIAHIADDELVQRQPGTSIHQHLPAALIPIAAATAAAIAYPRLRPGLRATIALVFGSLSLVAAFIALAGGRAEGLHGSEWTGVLLFPAGALLLGLAAYVPWRERGRWASSRQQHWRNRLIALLTTPLVLLYGVVPLGSALWATHKFRTPIGTFSIPHRDVSFRTSDGLALSGWYVPSRNGGGIVIVHGGGGDRDGDKRHAAMLARAGYGVLLYDARGRGQSEGDPDAYGWTWNLDVSAAIGWLKHQPDVKHGRIGALGLSTGADVLVDVAAHRHDLRAVVADGSTTRSVADVHKILHGFGLLTLPSWWVQYTAGRVLENVSPGKPLAQLAAHIRTPILFIASSWSVERSAAPIYTRAAHQPNDLWETDTGHTQGLRDNPSEYSQRVLLFFRRTLADREATREH
jgi:fermentation-respiration switch protein FrsA (DUF1100 family)